MKNTQSKGRPDQWIGDMTVWMRENAVDNSEQFDRLKRNLRKAIETELTPRQRQVITMYYFEGKKTTQISVELGVRRSTVSRTLIRARTRIQMVLEYSF